MRPLYSKDVSVFALAARNATLGARGFTEWFIEQGLLPETPGCPRCFGPCEYEPVDLTKFKTVKILFEMRVSKAGVSPARNDVRKLPPLII